MSPLDTLRTEGLALADGELGADAYPPNIDLGSHSLDLQKLLETRMLVQGSSGAGKSYLLRRLLEQSAPLVQQIIIDPEDEFSTLREAFPYLYCATEGGDIKPRIDTAHQLGIELRRSRASIVLGINDLDPEERCEFVGAFTLGLLSAPKEHWAPCIVAIDEAHQFVPDKAKPKSFKGVEGLASRGRKRGLTLILATQRLAKLHKDVASECLNKFIGRTGLDIDIARASEELGWTKTNARQSLSKLEPGHFLAHGPAVSTTIQHVAIGPVRTTHGTGALKILPPPVRDLSDAHQAVLRIEMEAEAVATGGDEKTAPKTATTSNPQRAGPSKKRVRRKRLPKATQEAIARKVIKARKPAACIRREAAKHRVSANSIYRWVKMSGGDLAGRRASTSSRTGAKRHRSK